MAWATNGTPDTLTSSGTTLQLTDLTAKQFNMFLYHSFATGGTITPKVTTDNNSATDYSYRQSQNGGSDLTLTSQTEISGLTRKRQDEQFAVFYFINIDSEEKLMISHGMDTVSSDATTAPDRNENVGKVDTTTNTGQFTRIDLDVDGTGSFDTDSNLSAIGSDLTPAAAIPFPTNVQLGSRAEITDTRKIYYLSNMSTSGLKAYYNFDSIDSSTTLTNQATTGDGLGSSADGTVTNATLDTTNEKLGTGCYNFDGTGDKVALGSSTTTLDFLTTGNSDWTVSFWMKLNVTEPNGNNAILCQGQGSEAGLDILFDDRSAESKDHVLGVRLEGNSGNTAMKLYTSAQFIPKDTDWHHYVITGDVSTRTVTAYRDGGNAESDSTGSGNFPTTLAQKPTFGVHPTSSFSGADLNAKLDDCSLWSRILTSDEISLLYNSGTGATPYTTKTWQEIGA